VFIIVLGRPVCLNVGMENLQVIYFCCPANPIRLPLSMEQVYTPLDWRAWDRALTENPDPRF